MHMNLNQLRIEIGLLLITAALILNKLECNLAARVQKCTKLAAISDCYCSGLLILKLSQSLLTVIMQCVCFEESFVNRFMLRNQDIFSLMEKRRKSTRKFSS